MRLSDIQYPVIPAVTVIQNDAHQWSSLSTRGIKNSPFSDYPRDRSDSPGINTGRFSLVEGDFNRRE